jgi:pimeloyl-ACP methyl ester carboxylesterase
LKAYFIPGLGADRRAFQRIRLPSSYQPVYLDWIKPVKNETLADYALRFSKLIAPGENFMLIGLSFGGMLASEIARIITPQKLIIISSLSCYPELPWYFKLAGRLGLHKILHPAIYKQATLINRFMGPGNKEMKAIVYDYVKNADPDFIRWSLSAILTWQRKERLKDIIHIHGSNDHLLPCKYVKADHVVEKGGHLMVLNKAEAINQILAKILG